MTEDFGIVIACSDQSYLFAQGCCASIRHFLGDVPICLAVDGDFSTRRLRRTYGVHVLDRRTVADARLAARSFGWGLTKMVALWQCPWPRFLCLDPDTMVWGDVSRLGDFDRHDVVLDQQYVRTASGRAINPLLYQFLGQASPDAALRAAVVDRCLFDIDAIALHFPDFDWRRHLNGYAWTGAFFARRDMFELDEYIDLLDFAEAHPGVFLGGEMGFLNFMIFRAVERGELRVANVPLQVLVCEENPEALRRRFVVGASGPVVAPGDATVIHWTGPGKPTLSSRECPEPMTFMRRKYQRDAWGLGGAGAGLILRYEELRRLRLLRRAAGRHAFAAADA
jgi:hypothetical protein